ncbi:MAG: hypothetical protein J0H98_03730 [Solirubrobacterales bacterium]|nr:hypothetical protein [Solirubrobacterales bacterium]
MSKRLVVALSALVVLVWGAVVAAPSAVAASSQEPCFGGVIAESDGSGQITGSECSDVIVAAEETTSIDGGDGDDVIIGSPNTVIVNGGTGWDYIVGNSFSAILMGGAGNDVVDAGEPSTPGELPAGAEKQVGLAASSLPEDEASAFLQAVDEQLRKAAEAAERPAKPDLELRREAIESNPLVQEVIGTPGADRVQNDEQAAEIESLNREVKAYEDATRRHAQKLDAGAGAGTVTMSREWGNDPIYGTDGNDILYGGRGTDRIYGRLGDDLLYGGIEDDEMYGNDGNDYLLGGFGADTMEGGPGDDILQGDATGDRMRDAGGTDVLSYASGGTDGFPSMSMSAYPNFPPVNSPERGVYVNLASGVANNGSVVGGGGGNDPAAVGSGPGTVFSDFEHVVGTPFADYIVGDTGPNVLEGGGGSDVINGGGGSGTDVLLGDAGGDNLVAPAGSWIHGGAGEDYCGGSTVVALCETKPSNWVGVRDTTKISVGMTTQGWAGQERSQLYMAGSTTDWFTRNGEDEVNVTQVPDGTGPPSYYFTTGASSTKGQFSTLPEDQTPGCTYSATQVICSPSTNAVTLSLAGFGSNDVLAIYSVFKMTSPFFFGGQGNDTLTGGLLTDDFLHDGSGADTISASAGDDGMVNTAGQDTLWGNEGDDLVESNSVCEGDSIGGGADIDSTSWVQYRTDLTAGATYGVFASISTSVIGKNVGGAASCSGEGPANTFSGFEDLEGSRHSDVLRGDSAQNQLIGRASTDQLRSYQNDDRIIANSADNDNLDCGQTTDSDIAIIDYAANGTDYTVDCETILYGNPIFPDS